MRSGDELYIRDNRIFRGLRNRSLPGRLRGIPQVNLIRKKFQLSKRFSFLHAVSFAGVYHPTGRLPHNLIPSSIFESRGQNSYTNGRPGVLTPKAAHATNGGHGINTAPAVPGKVALIMAVADGHMA
jgi:hypothetical protein